MAGKTNSFRSINGSRSLPPLPPPSLSLFPVPVSHRRAENRTERGTRLLPFRREAEGTAVETDDGTIVMDAADVASQQHVRSCHGILRELKVTFHQRLLGSQRKLPTGRMHVEDPTLDFGSNLQALRNGGQRHVGELSKVNVPGHVVTDFDVYTWASSQIRTPMQSHSVA